MNGKGGEGERGDWPLDSGAAEQKRKAERHWAGGDTARQRGREAETEREGERKRETWEVGRDFSKGNIVNVQRRCFNVYS